MLTRPVAAVLTGLILAAATVAGCGIAREEFSDERTETAQVAEVRMTGGSGSLTVERANGSVTIKRDVRYFRDRPGRLDRMDGSTLVLDGDCGDECTIDYRVTVPDAVKVTGSTNSGSIVLNGVTAATVTTGSGSIRITDASERIVAHTGSGGVSITSANGGITVESGSGDIQLSRIGGTVTAQTGSGNISGTGLGGSRTSVESGSGDVTLVLTAGQDVQAETGSGNIRLTVPGGDTYRVKTDVDDGDRDISVTNDPSGKYLLDLRTGSGRVTVKSA